MIWVAMRGLLRHLLKMRRLACSLVLLLGCGDTSVTLAVTIDARGRIAYTAVAESTGVEHNVALCIAAAVRRRSFVKPAEGREVAVHLSWQLAPG